MTSHRPSLHQFLVDSLRSDLKTEENQRRKLSLTSLISKPYKTYTLFPHSSDPKLPVLRTDYLIVLAETIKDYTNRTTWNDNPKLSSSSSVEPETKGVREGEEAGEDEVTVPIFAIEASLYRMHKGSISLIYISKIDSTGLSPNQTPASMMTIHFLNYFLLPNPMIKNLKDLRIHIFARAAREGQYLFPGSASNVLDGKGDGSKLSSLVNEESDDRSRRKVYGKRILDDQQLVKWWFKVLSNLIIKNTSDKGLDLNCFYILPGFDEEESKVILPINSNFLNSLRFRWKYGHPYNSIGSPITKMRSKAESNQAQLLSDLIPCFNDDPKARFINSLGSCSTNPSGETGDWDDAILERDPTSLESDRVRERSRMNSVGVDEFWIRMGARQECCDGRVSAFFVLAIKSFGSSSSNNHKSTSATTSESNVEEADSNNSRTAESNESSNNNKAVGVSRNVWVSLWSKIHNKDYSSLKASSTGYKSWVEDLRACILSELKIDSSSSSSKETNNVNGDDKNKSDQKINDVSDKEIEFHSEFSVENFNKKRNLEEEEKVDSSSFNRDDKDDNGSVMRKKSFLSSRSIFDKTIPSNFDRINGDGSDIEPKINLLKPRKKS